MQKILVGDGFEHVGSLYYKMILGCRTSNGQAIQSSIISKDLYGPRVAILAKKHLKGQEGHKSQGDHERQESQK